ncbi:MAG: GNAT family N-acetyltransferase [Holophagales bacterium]|nr:GNAT family N-acetyltransferase [Holophagales bacterium]MYG30836.1 GNAT family N-acetyltransferase [Holophagales bacterium]MYI81296.1 GNAT family N-acetyltransferase [Holophagales bacterium]
MNAETAWHRSLERLRAGAGPEDDLDRAIAGVLPRGDVSALPADGVRFVVGPQAIGDADALPDEVLIGWDGDADGYDRLILDLLEAGFRPLREQTAGRPSFRVLRARRDGYRIRGYRPGDEAAILELFRVSFGNVLSPERWRWRYVDNPRGGPRISLAFAPGGELVCQYCAYPVRWRGLSPAVPAVGHQVGDTMTRRSARAVGRGPTSLLARTSRHFYLTHCNGRVAFNYGFNTGNITKFSTRYVGAHVVEDVPYRELPQEARLGGRGLFGRRYELRRIAERSEIGAGFDALLDRVGDRYGPMVERSAEYLRWRYLDCPDERLELVAAYRRGRLAGWVAAKRLPHAVEWGDALIDPEERPALRALVAGIREAGLPVAGWFSERPSWWSRELDRLGFVRRPEPQDLVTIMVPFVCGDAVELMRGTGYYTKGDGDLF